MPIAASADAALGPWSARAVGRSPLAPLATAACVVVVQPLLFAVLYYGLRAVAPAFAGALHERLWLDVRQLLINALMFGFLPFGLLRIERAAARAREEMATLHRGFAAQLPQEPFGGRAGRIAGLSGIGVLFVAVYLPGGDLRLFARPDYWILPHIWNLGMVFALGWLSGRFLLAMVLRARDVSGLAAGVSRIDLLDRAGLAPVVRYGLSSSLLWVAFLTIAFLNMINPGARLSVLALIPPLLAFPAAALLLPVRGARARIREAKRERLADLRSRLRAAEDALARGGDEAAVLRIPALLALEARIDSVREWPFDSSSWARLVFYICVGLGSWIGAATVERALDWLWS